MGIILEAISVLAELQRYGLAYQAAGGDEVKVICPFHKDTSPSCHVNTQNRLFKCQASGCEQGGDIITLLGRHANQNRNLIILELSKRYDLEDEKVIDPRTVERWHESIWGAEFLRNELYRRGITDTQIRSYRLGESEGRITIPIRNRAGNFVNVRKYLPGAKGAEKFRNTRGYGTIPRWFNIEQLKYDQILICGGECKAIVAAEQLNQHGIGAISGTWGEKNVPIELLQDLKGKHVFICFDIDEAGEKAASKLATALSCVVEQIKLVKLPLDKDKYPKGDINDFIASEMGQLKSLLDMATPFEAIYVDKLAEDETEPIEMALDSAIHADNSGKRMKIKGIISAMDTTPYLVPKNIRIKCSKDQKFCAVCPVFTQRRDEYTIPKESPAILEFIGTGTNNQLQVVKSAVGIPSICHACEFERLAEYNVEDTRISPQLETSNRSSDRQPIPAYCIGLGCSPNENYEFTGKLVAHPKTQQATLLISSYTATQDALTSYSIEEAHLLSAFWPESWTTESISEKLSEIYADLAANVTYIWERQDLHLAIDLAYHSPLYISLDGQDEKGWVDLIIIGDTANGKSKCMRNLAQHYNLGQIFDCCNSTVAGLVGGMEKYGDRWLASWGAIPRNDRRLVAIEEASELPQEAAVKIRYMRSEGIAEMVKIGAAHNRNARVRMIWISNPPDGSRMSNYPFGVMAIKALMKTPQDIRRFDLACITTAHDVTDDVMHQSAEKRGKVEHRYSSDLCRQLVLWSWTRTREQIKFREDTTELILTEASRLCSLFSDAIPICDIGSMRYKLARLSAALAARLFSCSEDFESLVIYPCHVEYVVSSLIRMYSRSEFGYVEYSKAQSLLTQLLDPDQIKAMINGVQYPKDFCRAFLAQEFVELQDLANLAACDIPQANSMISLLVRKHALIRKNKYYRKSPLFIDLLKGMADDPNVADKPNESKEERF